jgi:hypothetical protein
LIRFRRCLVLASVAAVLGLIPPACQSSDIPRASCNTDSDCNGIALTCQQTEQGKACVGSWSPPTSCADASVVWQYHTNEVFPDDCCLGDSQMACVFQICSQCHQPGSVQPNGTRYVYNGSEVPGTFRFDTYEDTVLDGGVLLLGAASMASSASCMASLGLMPPPITGGPIASGGIGRSDQLLIQQWACLGAPKLPSDAGPLAPGPDGGLCFFDAGPVMDGS